MPEKVLLRDDYDLFRSMHNALTGIWFTPEHQKLVLFSQTKPAQCFWIGVHKLPETGENVIASHGKYYE